MDAQLLLAPVPGGKTAKSKNLVMLVPAEEGHRTAVAHEVVWPDGNI